MPYLSALGPGGVSDRWPGRERLSASGNTRPSCRGGFAHGEGISGAGAACRASKQDFPLLRKRPMRRLLILIRHGRHVGFLDEADRAVHDFDAPTVFLRHAGGACQFGLRETGGTVAHSCALSAASLRRRKGAMVAVCDIDRNLQSHHETANECHEGDGEYVWAAHLLSPARSGSG